MEDRNGGMLFLVGTPIGNLGDLTIRGLETLKEVDLIAAEDTRQTRKLLNHYNIDKRITSYYEHNKQSKGPVLIQEILAGKNIALVSDAGMPGISDPGSDLVRECIEAGIKVVPIPGPSAIITGLVASGLDTCGFVFGGFFPREKKEQQKILNELGTEKRTIVFYESPHRIKKSLEVIKESWGDRDCCVARELTKVYEEFIRGPINKVIKHFQEVPVKGEITLIIEGKKPQAVAQPSFEEAEDYYNSLTALGLDRKEAVKETAKAMGLPKRELYNRVMKNKKETGC